MYPNNSIWIELLIVNNIFITQNIILFHLFLSQVRGIWDSIDSDGLRCLVFGGSEQINLTNHFLGKYCIIDKWAVKPSKAVKDYKYILHWQSYG